MFALLAVICLLAAATLMLFVCVTTEAFARAVNGTAELQAMQQARIDRAAADLTARWQLQADVLTPWTENAAVRQGEAVAAWWGTIWTDASDVAMPAWLDAEQEGVLVGDVRRDSGFIALTDEARRRAIARDEVAYALDEAVCDAVTPLRRSIAEVALDMLADVAPLPLLRQAALTGAAVLAGLALALLILARRSAGSALMAAGLTMAAATVPVALADIPGMLGQLSDIAAMQGRNALLCLAILWYAAACVPLLTGLIVVLAKKAGGRCEP